MVTVEPTTCAVVSRGQFRDFVLAHPDFALHLIERLIKRLRATTDNVKSLALTDVYGADEAFVTGTFAGIVPVREIDGRQLTCRGPGVERLQQLYAQRMACDIEEQQRP